MSIVAALHIIGIIVWMGGLMMLSRLLGLHTELAEAPAALERFERRTYFWAVVPGGLLTLATGFTMLFFKGLSPMHYLAPDGPWGTTFHLKLTLVFLIFVFDLSVMRAMNKLHRGEQVAKRPFQIFHGMIGLCFVVIVIAVKTNVLG